MLRPSLRSLLPWLLLVALLAFVAWKLHSSHFDWSAFAASWRTADPRLLALAVLLIQFNFVLRALRWSVFLRPAFKARSHTPAAWWTLIGSQFIGFTGLSLLGRLGELIRPLLIARRTGLPFSSQIAVVAVERVFDLGAFALIFSLNLLLAPSLQSLPHHELFRRVGYTIAALTLILIIFVAAVRLAGSFVAQGVNRVVSLVSKPAGESSAGKVLAFRDGLNVIDNVPDFLLAAALSIVLWLIIALTYVLVLRAFPPPIHSLEPADALLLMGFSVVGGVVQLPGVGGGAQALTIGALTQLFNIPAALAVSAGLMVWLIASMSVIPFGLLYARIEGVSLRQTARSSDNPVLP